MDKLKMEARPMDELLKKVAAICPAAVQDNKIDFERLKQELAPELIEDVESYNFTWVGKKDAIMGASTPIRKTLRPCKEESKNWDTTKNLYIEGDNLDVLKLLQESYLGKVKMIYIDPPYNTGNDFVYCDDFSMNCEEYMDKKGQCDVETNERLFRNDESNGRYHSNWCSMMYPRLKVARDLLTDDGVIFISIDDNEQANLKKICDEIFGEENFVGGLIHQRAKGGGQAKYIVKGHDYILVYGKNISRVVLARKKIVQQKTYEINGELYIKNTDVVRKVFGRYDSSLGDRRCFYEQLLEYKGEAKKAEIDKQIASGELFLEENSEGMHTICRYEKVADATSKLYSIIKVLSEEGKKDLEELGINDFSYPKPTELLRQLIECVNGDNESIILDFFSGSATTAHAVMQLNAEDDGNRKFIMVQLPEKCPEGSKYSTICEIGKERIRRAGDKIVADTGKSGLDIGFKVLKLDDTNMKDVYYTPMDTTQSGLLDNVDNIKEDRSELDLLYGVMLDLGLQLDLDVKEIKSGNTTYYNVDEGSLIACFNQNIPDSIIKEIAELKPFKVVFRDSSFPDAPAKINVTEIFKTISPNTKITVL